MRAMLRGCVETQIMICLTISYLKGREYRLPTQETFKKVGGKVDYDIHCISDFKNIALKIYQIFKKNMENTD